MAKNKDSNIGWAILKFVLIVLAVALIIITLGWFIKNSSSFGYLKPDEGKKPIDDTKKPNPLEEELKEKRSLLNKVEDRIKFIEGKKVSILKREKAVFISARFLIGIILIGVNVWYLKEYNLPFALDKQLNINGAVVLVYSFLAFITYGTPSRFVTALKNKISFFLKRKHIDLIEELEPLRNQRVLLIEDIKQLELNLLEAKSNGREDFKIPEKHLEKL